MFEGSTWLLPISAFFLVAVIGLLIMIIPIRWWLIANASGVQIELLELIGMRLRKVPPKEIIIPLIAATKCGIRLRINELEAHHLAGGNVTQAVGALILADKRGVEMNFAEAAAIDLAGSDPLEVVEKRKALETGELDEIACPSCGKPFKVDEFVLAGWVKYLRKHPAFQELVNEQG